MGAGRGSYEVVGGLRALCRPRCHDNLDCQRLQADPLFTPGPEMVLLFPGFGIHAWTMMVLEAFGTGIIQVRLK